jgi:hypothetical protein
MPATTLPMWVLCSRGGGVTPALYKVCDTGPGVGVASQRGSTRVPEPECTSSSCPFSYVRPQPDVWSQAIDGRADAGLDVSEAGRETEAADGRPCP